MPNDVPTTISSDLPTTPSYHHFDSSPPPPRQQDPPPHKMETMSLLFDSDNAIIAAESSSPERKQPSTSQVPQPKQEEQEQEEEQEKPDPRPPSSTGTEIPISAQRQDLPSDPPEDNMESDDPAEKIADFDWNALSQRYHDGIKQCEVREAELLMEWESLMNFFKIWAEAGHFQETERTYHRLRTRMTYVEHSEENLEKKRQHYIQVVHAFQRALQLLQTPVS